jgi:acetyl esterase/lipase
MRYIIPLENLKKRREIMKKLLMFMSVLLILLTTACSTQTKTSAAENTETPELVKPTETATISVAPPDRGNPGGGNSTSIVAVPSFSDVAYANISSAEKLDLYIPTGEGSFPVVILVHGGAFLMGDKAAGDATTGIDQLLSQGFAVASVNYRLSGEAKAPAQIQDIKAAVRFLRANAMNYKLNSEKFGAWGGSAGGQPCLPLRNIMRRNGIRRCRIGKC